MDAPIRFFKDTEYSELSNYHHLKTPITIGSKTYKSSEHAYQSLKFDWEFSTPEQKAYAEIVRGSKTPHMSKELANQKIKGGYAWRLKLNPIIQEWLEKGVKPRDDFAQVKDAIMRQVCLAKFTQDEECRNVLLSTGNRKLIEQSCWDSYWGNGGDDSGLNKLGGILMEIREELRKKGEP